MSWNWEKPDWPNFAYGSKALEPLEQQFLRQSGEFVGACKHIGADDRETLKIELISEEAVKTSEIEGEILNRASVQSSLRQQFGLGVEQPGVGHARQHPGGGTSRIVDSNAQEATGAQGPRAVEALYAAQAAHPTSRANQARRRAASGLTGTRRGAARERVRPGAADAPLCDYLPVRQFMHW